MTSDICDKCWGSGDKNNIWTNLRKLTGQIKILKQRIAGLEEGIGEAVPVLQFLVDHLEGRMGEAAHTEFAMLVSDLAALLPGGGDDV